MAPEQQQVYSGFPGFPGELTAKRRRPKTRQEILSQIEQAFGFVFEYMDEMPDAVLDHYWTVLSWVLSDSALSGRDKALVAFGTASGIHCPY